MRGAAAVVRNLILAVAFAAASIAGDGRADGPASPPAAAGTHLAPGMTRDDVLRRLGPPKRIARQILYRRYLEQWIYEGLNPMRIEFDCVRGKEPHILTVQSLTPPGP